MWWIIIMKTKMSTWQRALFLLIFLEHFCITHTHTHTHYVIARTSCFLGKWNSLICIVLIINEVFKERLKTGVNSDFTIRFKEGEITLTIITLNWITEWERRRQNKGMGGPGAFLAKFFFNYITINIDLL